MKCSRKEETVFSKRLECGFELGKSTYQEEDAVCTESCSEKTSVTSLSCSLFQTKCFQLFTVDFEVSCKFVINRLFYAEVHSLYVHFLESFYDKLMLNFFRRFFCFFFEMIIIVFILSAHFSFFNKLWAFSYHLCFEKCVLINSVQ